MLFRSVGNSVEFNYYDFYDYEYKRGQTNYYRLSQTDNNEHKEYFKIIAVEQEGTINSCEDVEYFDLTGRKINIDNVGSGLYLKKCGDKVIKIYKN